MTRTLISQTHGGAGGTDCGYSGTVPAGEEWYTFLADGNHGAQGESLVGSAGQTVTVSRCHVPYSHIGTANGKNFHSMRKYAVTPEPEKYDCINGQCRLATQYNTPGLFLGLPACLAKCSLAGNNCDGHCISNNELTEIQQKISEKQRDCG